MSDDLYRERREAMTAEQREKADAQNEFLNPRPGTQSKHGQSYVDGPSNRDGADEAALANEPRDKDGLGQGLGWSLQAQEKERRRMFERLSHETGLSVEELMYR